MSQPRTGTWLLLAAAVAIVATIAWAISVTGTPAELRKRKLDERRIDDLKAIQFKIDQFHQEHDRLPPSLGAMQEFEIDPSRLRDPEGGNAYEYHVDDSQEYRLCAVFTTSSDDRQKPSFDFEAKWEHPVGAKCFKLRTKMGHEDAAKAAEAAADAAAAAEEAAGP